MIRKIALLSFFALGMAYSGALFAEEPAKPAVVTPSVSAEYKVGVSDIIDVAVLQPDKLDTELTVSPDGTITFPYIGSVAVKGLTLMQIQEKIQRGLTDYMKYPLVAVSLAESRSRIFFVYGEVNRPGSYTLDKDISVMQAITMAGGLTHVASMDNVKILRQKPDGSANTALTVNVSDIMNGKRADDIKIESGDVITVSQRFF